MGKNQHTTLVIPNEDKAILEQMARNLGYTQTRGAGAGKLGSISALVCAIARAQLTVMPAGDKKLAQTPAGSDAVTPQDFIQVESKGLEQAIG